MVSCGQFIEVSLLSMMLAAGAIAANADRPSDATYGKVGDPVHLVVGYQPQFTEVWSAVVIRHWHLFDRYLPKGSTVDFEVGVQGAHVITDALREGRQQIGYLGLAPAITAVSDRRLADLRLMAVTAISGDVCTQLLVRADAPDFADTAQQIAWLNGKRLAAPSGTCGELFLSSLLLEHDVKPAAMADLPVAIIEHSLRSGTLDATSLWEPAASKFVDLGIAKRSTTGTAVHLADASFVVVRGDLVRQRPDVVSAWLNAELDAQRMLADPSNATAIIRAVAAQTTGYTDRTLWHALFVGEPAPGSAPAERQSSPFILTPAVATLLTRAAGQLFKLGRTQSPTLPGEALDGTLARQVLAARDH